MLDFLLIATWLLFVFINKPLFEISMFDKDIINFYAGYELSAIIVSTSFMLVLYLLADKLRLSYLNLKKIDGIVRPAPWVRIKPKDGEGWRIIGVTIGSIITLVTGVVVYFQTVSGNGLAFRFFPEIPLILLFAFMNSFTEEVIFRLSYTTIVANEKMSPRISEFLSARFGGVHYFGIAPSGLLSSMALYRVALNQSTKPRVSFGHGRSIC